MKAILYVCHGTRVKEGEEQAKQFIERCKEEIDVSIQEVSFLELSSPTIEQGFRTCVEKGATEIVVIPILLLTAGHAKEDIPQELQQVQNKFPHINVKYGRPFGVHQKIIQLLLQRISETKKEIQSDARLLLVGRGSTDPDTKRDFSLIVEALKKESSFKDIDVCFLAATDPTFEEGLIKAKQSQNSQVFVVPYLLFTGVLMKGMQKTLKNYSDEQQEFILSNYLGYHPLLEEVLHERVYEQIVSDGRS
ncbi:sirohydrochlorin ferrochelatase [Priestia koreensis]|uniref:Sirohydrochlorin ferrochelatase n=2 Tax=Priestia koreensis TaxID=284581 RepID=A0A0M0LBX0_9BACI|nr:sirohydrochlorin ferrochelatase [Priestia koreensis]